MTKEELIDKLTPGKPHESTYPGNNWFPSGKADGVIFRASRPSYVIMNGQMVPKGSKLVGDKVEVPHDVEGAKMEAKAFTYLRPSSREDRTLAHGFTVPIGFVTHLGGLVDILATHNKCLRDERENGYTLLHMAAHDSIGRNFMRPEVLAHLKVIPAEEGIFCIVYDPDEEVA